MCSSISWCVNRGDFKRRFEVILSQDDDTLDGRSKDILRERYVNIVDKVEIVEENEANITIDSEQKAKAIGKNGINITLANMLTKHKLNLIEKEGTEKKSDISDLEKLFSI
jgi:hypothetical protein